jgi:uncharacterized protein (TIGR02246 family)
MSNDPIETVKALDLCWRDGRVDEAAELLAPDVVVVGSHGRRFSGRDAVLAGYRDFIAMAEVRSFNPTNYAVTAHGDAAVVEYQWTMQWTSGGQAHDERGREFLALAHTGGSWRIFWRMQLQPPG